MNFYIPGILNYGYKRHSLCKMMCVKYIWLPPLPKSHRFLSSIMSKRKGNKKIMSPTENDLTFSYNTSEMFFGYVKIVAIWKEDILLNHNTFSSVQFGSIAQSCPTLCDPLECCTPGHNALVSGKLDSCRISKPMLHKFFHNEAVMKVFATKNSDTTCTFVSLNVSSTTF